MARIKGPIKEIRAYDPETGKLLFKGTAKPPPDYVNVVRCRDCKHSRVWENNPMTCAFWTDQWDMPTEPNAFCSYGERRADHG